MNDFILNNGLPIPAIGFGTWQIRDGKPVVDAVTAALADGYRHIDTAAAYKNEAGVGTAISESTLQRKDIFLTTKLWNTDRGYDATLGAFERSLQLLQTDYLDLYLVHWPANSKQFDNWKNINADTWKAFEALYRQGRVKAIGVCNFMVKHLDALKETAEIFPMVNQIEYHPGHTQDDVVAWCKNEKTLVEAWSPIGSGRLLDNQLLKEIAAKYKVGVAQLCIKFCLQQEVLPLPKSVTPAYIKSNFEVDGFTIDAADMNKMNALKNEGWSGLDPDKVDF
ncbi:aldo/keto reductase [Niabella soli]|uniref:2,5-diketo-D-gluconic acid reductase n=1 Tax=Niabella soli DSM 19437 TaxID=929713 RepID=W0F1U7_9BACT|nr:aldo/keto reductase [Niabella soli]AHF16982.1 2,5-diketo-D-gluconic acid reductase [Niabella soli DSM 19437]